MFEYADYDDDTYLSEIEIWRPIPSHPGYEASSYGRIRSTPLVSRTKNYKILSQNYTRGYLGCQLNTVRVRVNRVVCEAFHGPAPSPKHEAAHADNTNINNVPENLSWQTSKENKNNQPDKQKGTNNPRAILSEADVIDIRARRARGWKLHEIHSLYPQVSQSTIACTYQRKSWSHL